ncbi:spore protein Tlp [Solibacillus silvestris]|nr:spore protein Tlp [Solibacillus silvestris]OBW59291.1 spore protein Tlp [Solibacillus silvestris]
MKNNRHEVFNKGLENAISLGKMINNTKENIHEAEISKEFALPDELENIEEKNARRRTAIAELEEQIKERKAAKARRESFK